MPAPLAEVSAKSLEQSALFPQELEYTIIQKKSRPQGHFFHFYKKISPFPIRGTERLQQMMVIPGFGPNIATGLVIPKFYSKRLFFGVSI
ncbi:MAG: hypothetical protein ACOZF2_00245 [Thermodesulfobacteriota bacterium]